MLNHTVLHLYVEKGTLVSITQGTNLEFSFHDLTVADYKAIIKTCQEAVIKKLELGDVLQEMLHK